MKNILRLFLSAVVATSVAFGQSTPVTKNPSTNSLLAPFNTGTQTVTVSAGGTLVYSTGAIFAGDPAEFRLDIGAETSGAAATAQAFAIQRANHTGTQVQSTVVNLVSDLAAKETPSGAQAKADAAQAASQPLDATLTGLAATTFNTAGQVPYVTAADTFATASTTTFGRSLWDDADAATARATLVLGNVDNTSDANKPVSTATQAALNLKSNLTFFDIGERDLASPFSAGTYPAGFTLISPYPAVKAGVVNKLFIYTGNSGAAQFLRLKRDNQGYFYAVGSITVTLASGANTLTKSSINGGNDWNFDAGDYLAFYSSSVTPRYKSGAPGALLYNTNGLIGSAPAYPSFLNENLGFAVQFAAEIYAPSLNVESIGGSLRSDANATISTVASYLNAVPLGTGAIKGFKADVAAVNSGTLQLQKIRIGFDGRWRVMETANVTATATGLNTWLAGVDFPQWCLTTTSEGVEAIALQLVSGGATVKGDTGSTRCRTSYMYYTGTASGTVAYATTESAEISAAVEIERGEEAKINFTASPGISMLQSIPLFKETPDKWDNGGNSWSYSSGVVSSSTAGLANSLRSARYFAIDRRVISWDFALTSASSTICFYTAGTLAGNHGSLIRLNASSNELEIYTKFSGSNAPTLITSVALGLTLATNQRYVIQWERDGRSMKVRLHAKAQGAYFEYSRLADPLGYQGPGPTGDQYDQGCMDGFAGVSVTAGSVSVYNFAEWAALNPAPQLMIFGDSITNGFSVTDAEKWSGIIRSIMPTGECEIVSLGGQTATMSTGGEDSAMAELRVVRPKSILCFYGTNTSGFAPGPVAAFWKMMGAKVYWMTIPSSSASTTTINALSSDVVKIPTDLAMTDSGAGTTRIADYYDGIAADASTYNDGVHPNVAGHSAIAKTVLYFDGLEFLPLGNTPTAAALATARTIDGVSFNGTANIVTRYQGSFSGAGTATTTFTVTIGTTMANTTYKVMTEATNVLSAPVRYVTNKTTTTFDVVYLTGLTGTVEFDWLVLP